MSTDAAVLVIRVEMNDAQDFDWLRNKLVPVVENECEEQRSRLDGEVTDIWWEQE